MVKRLLHNLIILCLIIINSDILYPQEPYTPEQLLTPDPKILIGTLENGLKYYIRENRKPEKRAELRLVVKAGSVLEDDDQQGLAHFDEHMAFNGTKSFPKQALVDFLEKTGVRFGPDLNAYTSFDETVYMLQVPTDSPDVVEKAIQILEEWAHEITFDEKEIDKERGVVIEEWRLRRNANYRVAMQHIPFKLYNSRYAERIVIGKKEILESCPYDALIRFYKDWYRPNLMAVIAVGDFDKNEIEKLIKKRFSNLKNPEKERKRIQYPVPDHKETLVSIAKDAELTRTSVEIIFKRDGREDVTAGDYRKTIIRNLYDAMLNNRIDELLQQSNPPFINAYVYNGRLIGTKYAFNIGIDAKENNILEGLETALKEVFRVKQHGFTETELERSKQYLLSRIEQYYRERDKTESRTLVEEYTRNFLTEEPIPGIEVELALYKQFLPTITVQEVNKLTDEIIKEHSRVITISAPEKESVKMPLESEILAVIDKAGKEQLSPYVDRVKEEPLISKMPTRGKIIKEKKIPSLGVIEWQLSNKSRVILKPTDFKNDEILFSAYSPGGTSLSSDSNYTSANFATAIIGQSGVNNFDLIELQKMLTGKIVSLNPIINELSEGFNGNASPKDIETLFQLIYLYGTSARRDTIAFSSIVKRYKEILKNKNVSPESAYNDTIQVTLSNYHYRGRPLSVQIIDEIDLDKSLDFYRDRFKDFSDFIFFFVGNFDVDSIKPLVENYIASLPSTNRKENWKDVNMMPPKGVILKQLNRGIEPKSLVHLSFTGPFKWSQENRYIFNSMIDALNIRLRETLREDKGGTYGVRINGNTTLYPRQEYSITINWGCNPERVEELVKEALSVIDSLKMKPLDPIYIEKVKETQKRTYEINLKKNNFWIANLQFYYSTNDNPEKILNYPKLVDNLKAIAIQDAVKKYFNMNNYVNVVLYPEKK